jgi:hypothetical protein
MLRHAAADFWQLPAAAGGQLCWSVHDQGSAGGTDAECSGRARVDKPVEAVEEAPRSLRTVRLIHVNHSQLRQRWRPAATATVPASDACNACTSWRASAALRRQRHAAVQRRRCKCRIEAGTWRTWCAVPEWARHRHGIQSRHMPNFSAPSLSRHRGKQADASPRSGTAKKGFKHVCNCSWLFTHGCKGFSLTAAIAHGLSRHGLLRLFTHGLPFHSTSYPDALS